MPPIPDADQPVWRKKVALFFWGCLLPAVYEGSRLKDIVGGQATIPQNDDKKRRKEYQAQQYTRYHMCVPGNIYQLFTGMM